MTTDVIKQIRKATRRRSPARPTIGGDTPFGRGVWRGSGIAPRDPDGAGIKSCPKNETGSWRQPFCFQSGPHGR